ncbi:hypothetical protein L9F63_005307, partial [Diploptera punctata]
PAKIRSLSQNTTPISISIVPLFNKICRVSLTFIRATPKQRCGQVVLSEA